MDDRFGALWLGGKLLEYLLERFSKFNFFIVNHNGFWNTQDGNVYMSDKEGLKFTLQLEHVHSLNNWWDFEAGMYLFFV